VRAGKPEPEDGYQKIEIEGMEFYIEDKLLGKSIKIGRPGWWIFRVLTVTIGQ